MVEKTANRAKTAAALTKLFILDTNVLLHDPTSVYRFEEHDVFLPIMTLEELDNNKKGLSEVSRNARQVTRTLDEIVSSHSEAIDNGIAVDAFGRTSDPAIYAAGDATSFPHAGALVRLPALLRRHQPAVLVVELGGKVEI